MNIFQKITQYGEDKVIHYLVSLLIADYTTIILWAVTPNETRYIFFSAILALMFTYAIGGFKEVYDDRHGGFFDWKDVKADVLGGVSGVILAVINILIL